MFNKKTDPLASSVKQVMQENALRRKLEQKLNEELGVASKKALPHELHDDYDAALKSSITEQSVAQTKEVGISREPPKEASASGKKPGLDTKGLTKMLDTPREDGGVKDIKEGILKNALAKMKGKKEKVVDAPDEIGAHIEAQSKLHVDADSKKMRKEETIADRVRIMMETGRELIPYRPPGTSVVPANTPGKEVARLIPGTSPATPKVPLGTIAKTATRAVGTAATVPATLYAATKAAFAAGQARGAHDTNIPDSEVGLSRNIVNRAIAADAAKSKSLPAGPEVRQNNAVKAAAAPREVDSNALAPRQDLAKLADDATTRRQELQSRTVPTAPKTPEVGSAPDEDANKGPATVQKDTVPVPGPAATPVAQAGPGAARAQSTAAAAARAPMAPKTPDASGPGRSWQDKALKPDTGN